MRKGSLVGPFILIVFGVVLLLNNLMPDLSLLALLAEYWPVVLVAWGVLRLIEILFQAGRSQLLPRSGVSGGEWAIVILIALAGYGLHFARAEWPTPRFTMHGLELFGEAYDFPVRAKQEAGVAPAIYIENLRGNVRLTGADTTAVTVKGRTTIRAFARTEAESANAKCPLEVRLEGDHIVVRTNQDRLGGSWKASTDLDISVPKGAAVEGHGRYGDFDISNIGGDVSIRSDNAGVRLTEIGGSARIDLKRSDIIRIVRLRGSADLRGRGQDIELDGIEGPVTIDGSYSGELTIRKLAQTLQFTGKRIEFHAEQVPGQIRMSLAHLSAENLVGPVRLKTSSRDVQLTGFSKELYIEMDRGDVELRPNTGDVPPITVRLESGDILFAVPPDARFGIKAETGRGKTINEFGPALSVEVTGRGSRLSGPAGKPAGVRLDTKRGDIVIRRSTSSPGGAPKRLPSSSV